MHTHVLNLTYATEYPCLEPAVGENLLLFYPDDLTPPEQAQFETHLKGCDACRERLTLRTVLEDTGALERLAREALHLLKHGRFEAALGRYNQLLERIPDLSKTSIGQTFFAPEHLQPLTAARTGEHDWMPFLADEYTPNSYALTAAAPRTLLPLRLEYADGRVKGVLTKAGGLTFFTLDEAQAEFAAGIRLVGCVRLPRPSVKVWRISPGKTQRLERYDALFDATILSPGVEQTLRMLRVLPLESSASDLTS
jgi:hypothetical protein